MTGQKAGVLPESRGSRSSPTPTGKACARVEAVAAGTIGLLTISRLLRLTRCRMSSPAGRRPRCRDVGRGTRTPNLLRRVLDVEGGYVMGNLAGSTDRSVGRKMPRFSMESCDANVNLRLESSERTSEVDSAPAQVSLAWVFSRRVRVAPFLGASRIDQMLENQAPNSLAVEARLLACTGELTGSECVASSRSAPQPAAYISTEELAA